MAFHRRCSEVGAALPRGAAGRQNFPLPKFLNPSISSLFPRAANIKIRDFVCHKQLLLEMVGGSLVIHRRSGPASAGVQTTTTTAGQCSVPMSPSAIANHCLAAPPDSPGSCSLPGSDESTEPMAAEEEDLQMFLSRPFLKGQTLEAFLHS